MKNNIEIEDWFDDLNKLIQDTFICLKNINHFNELRTDNKILQQDFFGFYIYQQWFVINIQIAKIFDCKKQQERNVVTLFSKIIKGDYDSDIGIILKKENRGYPCFQSIEEVKDAAKQRREVIKQKQDIIKKVSNVRNKIYAHTDIEKIKDFPTLLEIKELTELSSEIYNGIRGMLLGINTDFTKGVISLTLKDIVRLTGERRTNPSCSAN